MEFWCRAARGEPVFQIGLGAVGPREGDGCWPVIETAAIFIARAKMDFNTCGVRRRFERRFKRIGPGQRGRRSCERLDAVGAFSKVWWRGRNARRRGHGLPVKDESLSKTAVRQMWVKFTARPCGTDKRSWRILVNTGSTGSSRMASCNKQSGVTVGGIPAVVIRELRSDGGIFGSS